MFSKPLPRSLRILLIIALILNVAWMLTPFRSYVQEFTDRFDNRPAVRILFIGNSRTFYHNMPFMVRKIADAASSPYKYQITMHAPGGVRLEDHWNNPRVHELLKQKWDFVVLQGRSNEQAVDQVNQSFMHYGARLIQEVRANGATPVLYLSWRYEDSEPLYQQIPGLRKTLHTRMQESYSHLARSQGAQVVNVGKAWEMLKSYNPPFKLYEDTTHPTVHGSYLAALVFYRHFTGGDVMKVTYVPRGITPSEAELIKKAAAIL